jgi:hypothetical protein
MSIFGESSAFAARIVIMLTHCNYRGKWYQTRRRGIEEKGVAVTHKLYGIGDRYNGYLVWSI